MVDYSRINNGFFLGKWFFLFESLRKFKMLKMSLICVYLTGLNNLFAKMFK